MTWDFERFEAERNVSFTAQDMVESQRARVDQPAGAARQLQSEWPALCRALGSHGHLSALSVPGPTEQLSLGPTVLDQTALDAVLRFFQLAETGRARVHSVQLPQNVMAVAQLDKCQTSSSCTSTHRVQQASRAENPEQSGVTRATRQGGAVYVIATLAQLCEGNYWIWNAVAVFRAERSSPHWKLINLGR